MATLGQTITEIGEANGFDDAKTTELYIAVEHFIDDWVRQHEEE